MEQMIRAVMKSSKPFLIVVAMLVGLSFSATVGQSSQPVSRSVKLASPRALVVDLYRQHKVRSPFFQTRNRALVDKYFTKELADRLWRDAKSSRDEVGALDGDPLYNAQDMEIKKFSIGDATVSAGAATVPVTFENFGARHQIIFRLVATRGVWKISDIVWDDGATLLGILKTDSHAAESSQEIKVYLIALGDEGRNGKKIGCGDSLVAVTRNVKKTPAPLTAALRELLSMPAQSTATPPLENFWKGRNLEVKSVSIRNGMAAIHISGEVFVAGICDQPRIQSQIDATARQFPSVKRVKVFIGKQTLADAIR